MRIYLLGMPASGKSYWGKKVADHHKLNFLDLDNFLEENLGKSITQVFQEKGEEFFRRKEQETLHQSKEFTNTIISTGGGTPYFFDNMDFIKKEGWSIFINVSLEIIIERLKMDENRPMFQEKTEVELENYVQNLYQKRIGYYQQADFTFQPEL